jgi:hypothetical protein
MPLGILQPLVLPYLLVEDAYTEVYISQFFVKLSFGNMTFGQVSQRHLPTNFSPS